MKTRNYLITIGTMLLFIIVAWFSCEKEDNNLILKEASATADIEVPAAVAAYYTSIEIDEFYEEIAKERTAQPPGYEFVPIMIEMENEIRYLYGSDEKFYSDTKDEVIGIQFEGNGNWKDMGDFSYFEAVNFLFDVGNPDVTIIGSKGKGDISLTSRPKAENLSPPIKDMLAFTSVNRMLVSGIIKPNADDGRTDRNTKYKSKLILDGGSGIFDQAYGYANKVEFHNSQKPETCHSAILGYIFIKQSDLPDPKEL